MLILALHRVNATRSSTWVHLCCSARHFLRDHRRRLTILARDTVTVAASLLSYLVPAGTIYGFLLDKVMSWVIEQKLPIQIQDATQQD
jgi:hypothetical protein